MFHWFNLVHSNLRESAKRGNFWAQLATGEAPRSGKWATVEKEHLAVQPTCMACGGTKHLQVHHIKPFALHPEKELDPDNLITLCMDVFECHFRIGHGQNWHYFNPRVVSDAEDILAHPSLRKAREETIKDRKEPL